METNGVAEKGGRAGGRAGGRLPLFLSLAIWGTGTEQGIVFVEVPRAVQPSASTLDKVLFVLFQVVDVNSLSKQELVSIKEQNDYLRRHSVKTIKDHIFTYECVDFYKQPSLNNPLIRNSAIEVLERTLRQKQETPESSGRTSEDGHDREDSCPHGTVPIQIVNEQHFIEMNRMMNPRDGRDAKQPNQREGVLFKQTALTLQYGLMYGIVGNLDIWGLDIKEKGQMSKSKIYISNPDMHTSHNEYVEAGWMVDTSLNSSSTIIYIAWKGADQKECVNSQCPGFVQYSRDIKLGQVHTELSGYKGDLYYVNHTIIKGDGGWWLQIWNKPVGYWPAELFRTLQTFAFQANWGGEVIYKFGPPSPPMGNGRFPGGVGTACGIREMKYLDEFSVPQPFTEVISLSAYRCYKARRDDLASSLTQRVMYFGGPPGCTQIWQEENQTALA